MLKELFPEETNSQNNMGNYNSPQPIPQSIPQENSFDINKPITSGAYSQPEIVQIEQPTPMKFNVHTPQHNTFDMSANSGNVYDSSQDNNFNNIKDYNGNNNIVNNYNTNNYTSYGIGDYKKHAASDINWKRLVSVEVITSLLACVVPILLLLIVVLIGTKSISLATSLSSALSLVASFVFAGLTCVILQNFIDTKRHKNEGMFKGFNRLFAMWVVNLLLGLMIVGSFIIPAIPIIIYATTQNTTLFAILMFLAVIGMIVLDTWIILRYSLAQYLVVDGKSPIEAMRTSKKLMSGHKLQLLGLVLSFIGWYLVFYMFNSILYTAFMSPIRGEFNILGFGLGMLLMLIVTYILTLPLLIYFYMTKVEFYEDRVNNGLNELRVVSKGKPILLTLLLSIILTAASIGLIFLPGTKTTLESLINQYGPLLQTYGITLNSNLGSTDPSGLDIEGWDIDGNTGTGDDFNTGGDIDTGGDVDTNNGGGLLSPGLSKLHFSVPAGYTQSYVDETYMSYTNEDWDNIMFSYYDDFDLSFYKELYPGGEDIKVGGYDAYKFSMNEEAYDSYTCYIQYNNEGYYISADNQEDLDSVLNSIYF